MRSRTIAALVISGIAAAGALPVLAQQTQAPSAPPSSPPISSPADTDGTMHQMPGMGMQHPGMMGPGGMRGPGFLATGCGPKAAEQMEIALIRLSYRLQLTDAQKPLFDAFKTAALAAQAKLETVCAANAPAGAKPSTTPGATTAPATAPDLLAMLKSGLTVEQARLDAAQSVLPSFEALYNSLTDTQRAALMPGHGKWGAKHPGQGQQLGQRMGRPADPGRQQPGRAPQTPAAPATN